MTPDAVAWSIGRARSMYGVGRWGGGYFDINEAGHVTVHPTHAPHHRIDLKRLVDDLADRGLHPPLLIRFPDILRHRLQHLADAFAQAIDAHGYRGDYRCVYPIKVNQQRHVVEEMCDFGAGHGFGLEAGSKPELLAVLAMTSERDVPIICNGFKDEAYIEAVVRGQKLGKRVIPVVEQFGELRMLVDRAERHGVRPVIGVRVKLASRMASRWEHPRGMMGKFGLLAGEVVEALAYLKRRGMADCLRLVHCHPGSQISDLGSIRDLTDELGRVYVRLKEAGAGLEMIDIGGGLGVDYDGSRTDRPASMNYTPAEYADCVVERLKGICDGAGVEHPTIISESGRAMIAYHSVMVVNVLGVNRLDDAGEMAEPSPRLDEKHVAFGTMAELSHCYHHLDESNCVEMYRAAHTAYESAVLHFMHGDLSLEMRGLAERWFRATCGRILRLTQSMKHVPERLRELVPQWADTYFCNFSVFQSLPDSWAIGQRFPIMPIHRLDERPERSGVLADITCDSDGRVDRFITAHGPPRPALELHDPGGAEYLIGVFLVGAYQEILGDLHNLLGDTHAVHASLSDDGGVRVEHVIPGDTVREVLGYVQFDADELLRRIGGDVERAVEAGRITREESVQFLHFYKKGLDGYTYLEGPREE